MNKEKLKTFEKKLLDCEQFNNRTIATTKNTDVLGHAMQNNHTITLIKQLIEILKSE